MSNTFLNFTTLTASNFKSITKSSNVFVVDIDGDSLWETYLNAFPAGTDPIHKERTEHDCSNCKQFVRRVGNVVAVSEKGAIETVWDRAAKKASPPYDEVAVALRDAVKAAAINNLFVVAEKEESIGTRETHAQKEAGGVETWNHFHTGKIANAFRAASPDKVRGDYRTTVQVFERGLLELKPDAIDTVLSLIAANNLYRGEEHRAAVVAFQRAQKKFLNAKDRNRHVWTSAHGAASRFRNTVIGTLVVELSEGVDVESAVSAFEAKVAPQNYKRSSAIISPSMVKSAMEKIEELGLEPALERRFARIDDISVNDVLWVDSVVKPLMKGGIGDMLLKHAVATQNTAEDEKRAEDIGLDDFISRILPETTGMEVLFKGEHLGNLMSLTAPVHAEPKQLFRWTNDFAWSYGGNVADSIKERVKKAGGNVTNAKLRVSLSWFNFDDLDLHIHEPGGSHISYQNKKGAGGGQLDVDMNVTAKTREAVENVAWKSLPDGAYRVVVNNYTYREDIDVGFVIEVECKGKLSHFNYGKAVRNRQDVAVVTLHVKDGNVERFELDDSNVTTSGISREKWGLRSEEYIKVNAVTLSPNYWGDNAVGNKHTFFVLDGAQNDEATRGIYNEFLHPRLEEHRKVFEVIGEKTKCQPTEGQLSGVGFSSTKRDSVVVKVTQGQKQRLFNVQIGT